MSTKLKYLTKTVSGYPGLNFTEANYAAFLEAFETKTDEEFINALNRAVLESINFFPSLPAVLKAHIQNEIELIKASKQRDFDNKQKSLEGKKEKKPQGWLYEMFKQKRAEQGGLKT